MDAQQFNTFAMSLNHLQRLMRLSLKADLAQLELLNKALHGAQVPHNKVLVIGEIKQALGLPADDDTPPMTEQREPPDDDALVQRCCRLLQYNMHLEPGWDIACMRTIIALVREHEAAR